MDIYLMKRRLWLALGAVSLIECVLVLLHGNMVGKIDEGLSGGAPLMLVDVLFCIGGLVALILLLLLFFGGRVFGVSRASWKHGRTMTAKDEMAFGLARPRVPRSVKVGLVVPLVLAAVVGGLAWVNHSMESRVPSPFELLDQGALDELALLAGDNPELLTRKDEQGNSLLAHAVANDDAAALEYLLGQGLDPELKNRAGQTVLIQAVGQPSLLSLLLERGAKLGGRDRRNRCALHYALERQCIKSVELLLLYGVPINARDDDSRTPLMAAVENGFDVSDLLLNHGADPDLADLFGETPLHVAARKNNAAAVRALLRAGADKAVLSRQGWAPLHVAAMHGSVAVAAELVGAGVDIDLANEKSMTPLRCAVYKSEAEFVSFCLERGADVNRQGQRGNTCLHDAVVSRHFDIAALLIEAGADPEISNDAGVSGHSLICEHGQESLLEQVPVAVTL